MKKVSRHIPGYSYGAIEVAKSAVPIPDLEKLKTSAGFTDEDQHYLRLAGEVLTGQTQSHAQVSNHVEVCSNDSGFVASLIHRYRARRLNRPSQ